MTGNEALEFVREDLNAVYYTMYHDTPVALTGYGMLGFIDPDYTYPFFKRF